jgi:hypothetical protein
LITLAGWRVRGVHRWGDLGAEARGSQCGECEDER